MTRVPLPQNLLHHIYIDESSRTKHRFLLLRSIIDPARAEERLKKELRGARLPEVPCGEMKWTKVSATNPGLDAKLTEWHKKLVDDMTRKVEEARKAHGRIGTNVRGPEVV